MQLASDRKTLDYSHSRGVLLVRPQLSYQKRSDVFSLCFVQRIGFLLRVPSRVTREIKRDRGNCVLFMLLANLKLVPLPTVRRPGINIMRLTRASSRVLLRQQYV